MAKYIDGNVRWNQLHGDDRLGDGSKAFAIDDDSQVYTLGNLVAIGPKSGLVDSGAAATGFAPAVVTTKGDLYGYSTIPARIPVGTDGQALIADSSQSLGVRWGTAGAGSGSSFYPSMTVPAAANFTWVNQLSTSLTDHANRMTVVMPSNGSDPNFRQALHNTTLPPTYDLSGSFSAVSESRNYADYGLVLKNSGGNAFVFFGFDTATSPPRLRMIRFNSSTSVSAVVTTFTGIQSSPLVFLRITDDGVNRKYWISLDGWDYQLMISEATNTFVTSNQAGIGCANFTGVDFMFSVFHFGF